MNEMNGKWELLCVNSSKNKKKKNLEKVICCVDGVVIRLLNHFYDFAR